MTYNMTSKLSLIITLVITFVVLTTTIEGLNPSEAQPNTVRDNEEGGSTKGGVLLQRKQGPVKITKEVVELTKHDENQEKEEKDRERWKTRYVVVKRRKKEKEGRGGRKREGRKGEGERMMMMVKEEGTDRRVGNQPNMQRDSSMTTRRPSRADGSRRGGVHLPSSRNAGMHISLQYYFNFLNFYLPRYGHANKQCQRDLKALSYGIVHIDEMLKEGKIWPLKLIDSWGKTADGILDGNVNFMGFFKECININVQQDNPEANFIGKYCTVAYKHLPVNYSQPQDYQGRPPLKAPAISASVQSVPSMFYSTCMPSTCSQEELWDSVVETLNQSQFELNVVRCQTKDDHHELTTGEIFGIVFFSVIGILLLSASVLDVYAEYFSNGSIRRGPLRYLLVFSVPFNIQKLFHLDTTKNPQVISCLHGLRFLSICWVVLGHQYAYSVTLASNLAELPNLANKVAFQMIANGDVSVDTFFFMSGLLVCYSFLNQIKKTKVFNTPVYYFHRFIRLFPPIAITCAFLATLSSFLVKGPLSWYYEDYLMKGCRHSWWMDVTFISNFVYPHLSEMNKENEAASCLPHCWFTAVDMQLYIITPLIVLPLYLWEKRGLILLALWTIAAVAIPSAITGAFDLWPASMLIQDSDANLEYNYKAYLMPWCRAGPYIVGIAIGYVFYIARESPSVTRLSKFQVILGWVTTTAVALSVIFGIERYNKVKLPNTPPEMSLTEAVLYGGFHRTVWGAVLGWIVLACHWGYGGPVNWFLSHPLWQPLSRLTYCIYLTSLPIQFALLSSTVRPSYFNNLTKLEETCGVLLITIIASIMLTLVAEAPILRLEKLILHPYMASRRPPEGGSSIPPVRQRAVAFDEKFDSSDESPRHRPVSYASSAPSLPSSAASSPSSSTSHVPRA